jgi:hypothetical protein
MGTSSSYKGSTSKLARRLRDGLGKWADSGSAADGPRLPESVVAPALHIPTFSRTSTGGGGATGGGGSSGSGSGQSGPRRNARAYAATAGRAAGAARALREGDREALERQGLDFDRLSAMPNRAEMVRAILEAVCDAQSSSDIPNEEQRDIAGLLIDWMLDTDVNPEIPDTVDVAEYSIGLIVAEVFISEASEITPRAGMSRQDFIDEVYEVAQQLGARAELRSRGAAQRTIEQAIESGLRYLRKLYPKDEA